MTEKKGFKPVYAIIILAVLIMPVVCLGVLAWLSYQTTHFYWDGGFPPAEFVVQLVDEEGDPIQNAWLEVESADTGEPSYEYPVYEFTQGERPTTGPDGQMVFHQVEQGIQFGGEGWDLFWLFPMGSMDQPNFTVTFRAEGYQDYLINIWDLYNATGGPVEITEYDWMGILVEMQVFETQYVMRSLN
jgi:hypothetical protein